MLTLLPDNLSLMAAAVLITLSFCTSLVTATFGVGGGVAMLAGLSYLVPLPALIPLHAVIQLGSNTGRAFVQRKNARWSLVWRFAVWGLLGALCASLILVRLPENLVLLAVGVFTLVTSWVKIPALASLTPIRFAVGAWVSTFLTFFVGATGPLIAVLLGQALPNKLERVATDAAMMTVQHTFKIPLFLALGFAFSQWVFLLLAMIVTGFLGTLAGTRILGRLKAESFETGFRLILTLLALDILRRAFLP